MEAKSVPENEYFRIHHLRSNLGDRTARGGAVTMLSQALKFVLSMGATMVLARLLTPEDYGLIGMVSVITGFVSMFKDLGLSMATIQKEEITEAQVTSLFWINLALSGAIMLITASLAPAVAWFYREPRLESITIACAAGFLLGGVTVQHEALLKRQMRFTALAVLEIISLIVSIGTAIVLGWLGAHYWALVVNQLLLGLVYAVGIWSVCRWRPGYPKPGSGIRSMLAFGRNLTGFSIANYFARNLDNLLIGKVWGTQQLGFYAKAYQLLLLPIDQINSPIAAVAVPSMSRLMASPERYRQAYLRILEKVAILTMPGMALMIATSDWLVQIVLGTQWSGTAPIFAVLGLSGLVQPIANTVGWLFISQGRARHMFQWGLIGSTMIVASIVAGLPWGAIGVATSYSIVFLVVAVPLLFWFVGREGPVKTSDFYRTIAPAALASICVLGALLILRHFVEITYPWFGLMIGCGVALAITLLILMVLPAGRAALRDAQHMITMITRE